MRRKGPRRTAGEGSTFIPNFLSQVPAFQETFRFRVTWLQGEKALILGYQALLLRQPFHRINSETDVDSPVQVHMGKNVPIVWMRQLYFLFYINNLRFCCYLTFVSLFEFLRTTQESLRAFVIIQVPHPARVSPANPTSSLHTTLFFISQLSMEPSSRFHYSKILERPRCQGGWKWLGISFNMKF